jgi:hypothetical protein
MSYIVCAQPTPPTLDIASLQMVGSGGGMDVECFGNFVESQSAEICRDQELSFFGPKATLSLPGSLGADLEANGFRVVFFGIWIGSCGVRTSSHQGHCAEG